MSQTTKNNQVLHNNAPAGGQKIFYTQLISYFQKIPLVTLICPLCCSIALFMVMYLLVYLLQLLTLKLIQQFTNLLPLVDSALFNQSFLVCVWQSYCWSVAIAVMLWLFPCLYYFFGSTAIYCKGGIHHFLCACYLQVRVYSTRDDNLLQKYWYVWRIVIPTFADVTKHVYLDRRFMLSTMLID